MKKKSNEASTVQWIILGLLNMMLWTWLGYMLPHPQKDPQNVEYQNFWSGDTHYLVFTTPSGGMTTVNYTLDSTREAESHVHWIYPTPIK